MAVLLLPKNAMARFQIQIERSPAPVPAQLAGNQDPGALFRRLLAVNRTIQFPRRVPFHQNRSQSKWGGASLLRVVRFIDLNTGSKNL